MNDRDELQGYNMYAYCGNNPVMYTDPMGELTVPAPIIGAFVGGIISGIVSAVSQWIESGFDNIKLWVVVVNGISGAISGAIATTGIGRIASMGVNAALGGATYAAEQAVKGEKITVEGLLATMVAGSVGGVIGGRGLNANGLKTTWNSASNGIIRESRRANIEYATKQIAKYTAQKVAVKRAITVSIIRYALGTIANTGVRSILGY